MFITTQMTEDPVKLTLLLIQVNGSLPVEVKAEVNLKAKSLKAYQEKFSPEISIRTSISDYKKEEWLINLPLYAINQIAHIQEI